MSLLLETHIAPPVRLKLDLNQVPRVVFSCSISTTDGSGPSPRFDYVQQRPMDSQMAVIINIAGPAKFIHERADPGTSRPNHLGQGRLADLGTDGMRR